MAASIAILYAGFSCSDETCPTNVNAGASDAIDGSANWDANPFLDSGTDGNTCESHTDCQCPDGVCVSTGVCWCPPCESDEDCLDGEQCRSGNCVDLPPECDPPVRISPEQGPSSGGTLLVVEGMEFYIGALEWGAQIGDGPMLFPIYNAATPTQCSMAFYTPPMDAGTYSVRIGYGGLDEDPIGTFTYSTSDEILGEGSCRSDAQCGATSESCELGMGRCIPNLCLSLQCEGHLCDAAEGCLSESDRCESDSDCRLIYSDCSCDAVTVDDPQSELTSCLLGGCETCDQNRCEAEMIEAACVGSRCTERRGDPEGSPCDHLQPLFFENALASDSWIRSPAAATNGENVAVVWSEPDEPSFRYGTLGLAVVDPQTPAQVAIETLDQPDRWDSNPAIASNGTDYAAVWLSENPTYLSFQAVSSDGAPIATPQLIVEVDDAFLHPVVHGNASGYDVFWVEQDWGEEDGLYHAQWSESGETLGETTHLSWVLSSHLDRFVSYPFQDHFVIAWQNEISGREGLYASHFPLGENPVQQVTERSSMVDLVTTPTGYALVWRVTPESESGSNWIMFRTYDQDDRPLIDAITVSDYTPLATDPRVSYLGGIYLVSWFERDGHEETDPYRLVFRQVRDDGRPLSIDAPDPIELTWGQQFHVRVDRSVLVGWVDAQGAHDELSFARWDCVE